MSLKYLWLLLLSYSSFAHFDFKYGASARSFPQLGGALEATGGYSLKLWGNEKSPWFGMIRTSVLATHTVVVNDYDAALTFYPISFLAFGVGHKELYSRYNEFAAYDCETTRCEGTMKKDYALGKLALGYGGFLLTGSYSEFRNTYNDPSGLGLPVAEYEWTTAVNPGKERSKRRTYFTGYQSSGHLFGLAADYRNFEFSKQFYKFQALIYQKTVGKNRFIFGIGGQESNETGADTVIILRYAHIVAPSMAIF